MQFTQVISGGQGLEDIMETQKNESIAVLAARIAHDFNNSLTAILSNVSLARMYKDPDKIQSKLLAAEKEIMQARDLAHQLLTLSVDDRSARKTSYVRELLRDLVNLVSIGSGARFDISIPADIWPVEMDESQIRQALTNIIINADQAMPQGGVVKVSAENASIGSEDALLLKDGDYVRISIEDQGIGIPEENLQKIFGLYFSTKKKGTGLGLTTAYIIIKDHKGAITVESEMGVGTKFHIYLPASLDRAVAERVKQRDEPIAGSGRILVVDDEKYIRNLVSEMLNNVGYRVTTAMDGNEAFDLYRRAMDSEQPYDAVIVDLTIHGGMDGKETIRRLMDIDSSVKAIITSGYTKDPAMIDFRRYGFKAAIAKPYRVAELSALLHDVING